jgi:hypothetical protein
MNEATATIFASLPAPHRISTYRYNKEILGYSCLELLRGRSIKIFNGPNTDTIELTRAIKSSALNTPVTVELDLYHRGRICRHVTVACAPFCSGLGEWATACRISIHEKTESLSTYNISSDLGYQELDRTKTVLPFPSHDRITSKAISPLSVISSHAEHAPREHPRAALASSAREPVPSPYIRRPAALSTPSESAWSPPSPMRVIVWKRLPYLPK